MATLQIQTYLQIAERTVGLLSSRFGADVTVAGMQIAQVGGLLGLAHVDAVQQNVGAGAA